MRNPKRAMPAPGLRRFPDGYWRLDQAQLRSVGWVHMISGVDAEPEGGLQSGVGAMVADISGYTEWTTQTEPPLSLGWDWDLKASAGTAQFMRAGEPRSDVMVVDIHGRDLGPVASAVALALFVDELPWERTVARYLNRRYS